MQLQKFVVAFDSGESVEVQLKSRDLAKAERLGVNIQESSPLVGSYALAFIALQRMHRNGELTVVLPETSEALEDIADLEMVEDGDAEGEGSGQGPAIG